MGPRGARNPHFIARGEFGRIGAVRILDLLEAFELPSTWFIPGHTIDTWPDLCERVATAGHEVGYHGYCHEWPTPKRSLEDQRDLFQRSIACIERVSGRSPVGHRMGMPADEYGARYAEMLMEFGFVYDSSMAPHDTQPTYWRSGDVVQTEGPFLYGKEIDLVILPFDWHLDDWVHFTYEGPRGHLGLRPPGEVYEVWAAEFDYLYNRLGSGVFVLTMHPQCIGKGSRMLMLERLIEYMKGHDGVRFRTMADVAEEFRRSHPLA